MLGLKRGTVKLIPHQKQWRDEFIKEKNLLHSILGEHIEVEHVGSTAVPELLAKPIIDIAIGLTPESQSEQIKKILVENGYEDRGDDGSGGHLFVKGSENIRTHHLHIIEKDSELWKNYISFCDYLKSHKPAREEYNLLKRDLEKKYANNREAYTISKADFIKKILKNL